MGKHAIIVIKNKDNYLQYFDTRWDSYLFLNCKVEDNSSEAITDYVSDLFDLSKESIQVSYVGEKIHSKYSESHKEVREYDHYFFQVECFIPSESFTKDSIKYKWFTFDELMKDERIQKVNSDIVGFIKEFNL